MSSLLYIIVISISVVGLVITIASFLVSKIWRDSESNNANIRNSLLTLNEQTNSSNAELSKQLILLSNAVTGLTVTVGAQGKVHDDFKFNCNEHKSNIFTRLNAHSETLKEHEKDITIIKTKIQL